MNYLTIDGGVHKCAVAEWAHGRLDAVYFVPEGARTRVGVYAELVIVERPCIRGNATPNPQTIVDLAWASAALAYSYGIPVKAVTPGAWKGSVPKPIHHNRVLLTPSFMWPGLAPAELIVLERALPGWADHVRKALGKALKNPGKRGAEYYGDWEGHNLLDTVCLGIWARNEGIVT